MDRQRVQVWTAALLAFVIASGARLRTSHYGVGWHMDGPIHLLVHSGLFALLTVLLGTSSRSPMRRWLYFGTVVLLGLGTEFEEHLRDGYPVERMDVLVDCLGAALGLAVANAWSGPRAYAAKAEIKRPAQEDPRGL